MISPTLIHHFLERSAANFPDKIALIHGRNRATYKQINNAANHLASWLINNNGRKGDRVVLLLENSLEYVISYYGILKSGSVAVPLNTDIKPDTLKLLLGELEPKVIISNFRYEKLLKNLDLKALNIQTLILINPKEDWSPFPIQMVNWADIIPENPSVVSRKAQGGENPQSAKYMAQREEDLDRSNALTVSRSHDSFYPPHASRLTPDDALASIIYTSGSTGKPKGVMLSHRNIVSNTQAICQSLEITADDIQMVVLPFFYVMGKSLLNTHFAAGGTVIINNMFSYPASVINEMVTEKVTGFSGVPSTYAYLLHRSPLKKFKEQLTSLRYCSQAGGHMARSIKEKLSQVLPEHTKIYIMYGATEAAARLSCLNPGRYHDKMDSIGWAIDGVQLNIISSNGEDMPLGETGELIATGPNIMQGYWKDPEATKEVLRDNRYYTGDLAFRDEEGFFYVFGRKDDQVKVGGHRINPIEVEDILFESGQIVEALVVGVPDGLLGHKLVAFIVPQEKDYDENAIMSYCSQRLPKFKIPSAIKIMKALPKKASGKIDRAKCLELLQS